MKTILKQESHHNIKEWTAITNINKKPFRYGKAFKYIYSFSNVRLITVN